MKILLTGAGGQLGCYLAPRLAEQGELVTSARSSGDLPCDLSDPDAVADLLAEARPELIVNAAAWTGVDAAEDEPEAAAVLNARLPEQLAAWSQVQGARLVHFSTDYVFDGAPGRPWTERDAPAPASVYGKTKLAGEEGIRRSRADALILRTAWLYSRYPGNFLSAILRRAGTGESLQVVSDQTGSPTWAGSLARMTSEALAAWSGGTGPVTLHAVDQGSMSWHEFAGLAVTMAAERGLIAEPVSVWAITSDQWPQKARRPGWSVLDVSRLEQHSGEAAWSTRRALAACLDDLKECSC